MKEKSYRVWFKPVSNNAPASYHVIVVRSVDNSHYTAIIVAGNVDTPRPQNASGVHWLKAGTEDIETLCAEIDNEIMALNPGKEANYSGDRGI